MKKDYLPPLSMEVKLSCDLRLMNCSPSDKTRDVGHEGAANDNDDDSWHSDWDVIQ